MSEGFPLPSTPFPILSYENLKELTSCYIFVFSNISYSYNEPLSSGYTRGKSGSLSSASPTSAGNSRNGLVGLTTEDCVI